MAVRTLPSNVGSVQTAALVVYVTYLIGWCQVGSCACQVLPEDTNHRFAVAFDERHRQQVLAQLKQTGYKVLSEGPEFLTVALESPQVPSQGFFGRSRARRRLIARQRQQNSAKHLKALRSIPGASRRHVIPAFDACSATCCSPASGFIAMTPQAPACSLILSVSLPSFVIVTYCAHA